MWRFLQSLFLGSTAEDAGAALGVRNLQQGVRSAQELVAILRDQGGSHDYDGFAKMAAFELTFLFNHLADRAAASTLAPALREEFSNSILGAQAITLFGLLEGMESQQRLKTLSEMPVAQERFNQTFARCTLVPKNEDSDSGVLFAEFAKHLGAPIGADKDAFFVASATTIAAEGFMKLRPHEAVQGIRRLAST